MSNDGIISWMAFTFGDHFHRFVTRYFVLDVGLAQSASHCFVRLSNSFYDLHVNIGFLLS